MGEMQSDREHFELRLRELGATAGELTDVLGTWDMFDESWTPERRSYLVRASDPVLLAELAAWRNQGRDGIIGYPFRTGPIDDDTAAAAAQVVVLNVDDVLAWVDDDPDRGELILALEKARPKPRVTLLDGLRQVIDG